MANPVLSLAVIECFKLGSTKNCGFLIIISAIDKDFDYFFKCKMRKICKNVDFVINSVRGQSPSAYLQLTFESVQELIFESVQEHSQFNL